MKLRKDEIKKLIGSNLVATVLLASGLVIGNNISNYLNFEKDYGFDDPSEETYSKFDSSSKEYKNGIAQACIKVHENYSPFGKLTNVGRFHAAKKYLEENSK